MEDRGYGFAGGLVFAYGNLVGSYGLVVRGAAEVAGAGGFGVCEVGARGAVGVQGLHAAALVEDVERGFEVEGGKACGGAEELADGGGLDGAAAERDHDVVRGKERGQGFELEGAKVGLAVVGEDLWDGLAGVVFDLVIEVVERPAGALREHASDGGFARAHEAGENDAGGGGHEGLGYRV